MPAKKGFIPPHGNYRKLLSYQKAEVIYDITYRFCHKYLSKFDRTMDQMIQGARSGKQNIAEGNQAGGGSKETEIKLTIVARGSLAELREDYEDYLRVRDFPLWTKDSKEALAARKLGAKPDLTFEDFRELFDTRPPQTIANITICLIHQTNYLLDQQVRKLEQEFLKEGGIKERMFRARNDERRKKNGESPSPD